MWQVGTDGLENLFAVVQTLTHARNTDLKDLASRLGATVSIERMYNDYPDLKRVSTRWNGSLDHIEVSSWDKGSGTNADVHRVDFVLLWGNG